MWGGWCQLFHLSWSKCSRALILSSRLGKPSARRHGFHPRISGKQKSAAWREGSCDIGLGWGTQAWGSSRSWCLCCSSSSCVKFCVHQEGLQWGRIFEKDTHYDARKLGFSGLDVVLLWYEEIWSWVTCNLTVLLCLKLLNLLQVYVALTVGLFSTPCLEVTFIHPRGEIWKSWTLSGCG